MKNILLTFLCCSIVLISFGQGFEAMKTDTTLYGSHTDSDFSGLIHLKNNASSSLILKWKRTENNLPTGWKTSICDPASCKTPEVDSAEFLLPVNGQSNYINIHFYPDNVEGIGTTKIRVENTTDASNYYVLSFVGDARTTTGIETLDQYNSSISFYPNPTKGMIYIKSSNNEKLTVTVYNLLGEKVLFAEGYETITQNLSDFKSGIYLINISNGYNNFTERLVLK